MAELKELDGHYFISYDPLKNLYCYYLIDNGKFVWLLMSSALIDNDELIMKMNMIKEGYYNNGTVQGDYYAG